MRKLLLAGVAAAAMIAGCDCDGGKVNTDGGAGGVVALAEHP